MSKPSFTACVIVRNMANTLPKLGASLEPFLARGGEWIVVDTGSTDGSAEVARRLGAQVTEAGERFMVTIDDETASRINGRFVVEGEPGIVQGGSRLFHFANARNFGASLATNDWVSWCDADEAYTALDLDRIEGIIANPNLDHCEYRFIFAHGPDGVSPALEFTQSKMYRRSRIYWTGAVHEVITPVPGAPARPDETQANRTFLDPSIFLLEHWQEPREHRANYLPGLGWDAWMKLTEDPSGSRDRQFHYLAREMMWLDRPRSATKLFEEHISMNAWPAERSQSMIFLGDCLGCLGDDEGRLAQYSRAFNSDPHRREPLLRLAAYFRGREHAASAAYAAAALEIPFAPFYANDMSDYREAPHVFLYMAKGWLGDIPGAQQHLLRVLDYAPFHPEACRDIKFYFDYDPNEAPEGWMHPQELLWLHEHAKEARKIIEVGSWKGRSTHALATGATKTGGVVWAVDHWRGASDERDLTHGADSDDTFSQFQENTQQFSNILVRRADSLEAAKMFPDGYADLIFLDATHLEDAVRADILAWAPKVRDGGILSGHDYCPIWPGVMAAVNSILGPPDNVRGSIWEKRMSAPPVHPLLPYLTSCVREGKPVSFIKRGDGEETCMRGEVGANCDGHPYSEALGRNLRLAFHELGKMQADRREGRTKVNVVPFEDQRPYNVLLHRNDSNLYAVKEFWGAVRESTHRKIFVGPARLAPAARMLGAEHFEIPLVNAFAEYDQIKMRLQNKAVPGAIFIFCAGMPAKPLIAELLSMRPNLSCIDAGSAWDPVFVGQTRTEQLPQELLKMEYREWLEA